MTVMGPEIFKMPSVGSEMAVTPDRTSPAFENDPRWFILHPMACGS
jgi:hypothetical protein